MWWVCLHLCLSKENFHLFGEWLGSIAVSKSVRSIRTTDIQGISQTSYIALCNGISHRIEPRDCPMADNSITRGSIGGLQPFADYSHTKKFNANASMIFLHCAMFYWCLASRLNCSKCRWDMHLITTVILIPRKNPKISLVYLWVGSITDEWFNSTIQLGKNLNLQNCIK